jgi:hypothetical protein
MPLPFTKLYGKTSANLYAKAFGQHMQAKKAFEQAADTYFMANDAASYDDWKRARAHWNYFCEFASVFFVFSLFMNGCNLLRESLYWHACSRIILFTDVSALLRLYLFY